MSISTLSQFDRGAIHQLLIDGHSQNEIARRLSMVKLTISTELKLAYPYDSKPAKQTPKLIVGHCGRNISLPDDLKDLIKNIWN